MYLHASVFHRTIFKNGIYYVQLLRKGENRRKRRKWRVQINSVVATSWMWILMEGVVFITAFFLCPQHVRVTRVWILMEGNCAQYRTFRTPQTLGGPKKYRSSIWSSFREVMIGRSITLRHDNQLSCGHHAVIHHPFFLEILFRGPWQTEKHFLEGFFAGFFKSLLKTCESGLIFTCVWFWPDNGIHRRFEANGLGRGSLSRLKKSAGGGWPKFST